MEKFFGVDHTELEKKVLRAYAYSKSDVSAFINILDTINDYILAIVHKNDTSLKGYSFGKIGSCVSNDNPPLKTRHPDLFVYCKYVHDLRLKCDLSHPVVAKTKRYTKPIEYKELYKVRKLLVKAIEDINF